MRGAIAVFEAGIVSDASVYSEAPAPGRTALCVYDSARFIAEAYAERKTKHTQSGSPCAAVRNGRNQVVRIPREFELTADEVVISREDDRLVIVPVHQPPSLAEVLSRLRPLDEDFSNTADPATKPQDLL